MVGPIRRVMAASWQDREDDHEAGYEPPSRRFLECSRAAWPVKALAGTPLVEPTIDRI